MLSLEACAGRIEVGAKAETLARARIAGLPVPAGVVILPGETVEAQALGPVLDALGGKRFAVRSSSSIEDQPGRSAAGIFESVIGVGGTDAVVAAIARVRASSQAEPARAYLEARGLSPGQVAVAVLIQPEVELERFGVARSSPDAFVLEERGRGEPEWGDVERGSLPRGEVGPLATGLRALEALVGGPVDVEYARSGAELAFLQARPSPPVPREEPFPAAPPGRWRLDAEHNPEPLSAAQAGLVAWVDALGVGARQIVLGGFLFQQRGAARRRLDPIPLADLVRRYREEVAPDCEAVLGSAERQGDLAAALAAYAHVYRRYVGELAPALRQAREELDRLLRACLGEPLGLHGALLGGMGGVTRARDQSLWELGECSGARRAAALEEHLRRFGAYAPAWDVATPCDDEVPERTLRAAAAWVAHGPSPDRRHAAALREAQAAARALLAPLPPAARDALSAMLERVREVLPIAEDDDLLFFRAQRVVRRALLQVGRAAERSGALPLREAIFDVPLEAVRTGSGDWRALAAVGQAARLEAGRRAPPVELVDGQARYDAPAFRSVLVGHPTQGRAQGRAVVVRDFTRLPEEMPPDGVLVVAAILPSMAYLLPTARALVTAHGGAHSHGATLAREYGVPAVLGVRRAETLEEGMRLYVDGAGGKVYVMDAEPAATESGSSDPSPAVNP